MQLASTNRCSAYDCEFVALARYLGVPLVTEDRQLLEGFPGIARTIRSCL
jgi:predicted nucleic acid-binding protein